MEFLKPILGDMYDDVKNRIDAYNAENQNEKIELADIGGGGYIPKSAFDDAIFSLKKENAIDMALAHANAKNPIAVKALLDTGALEMSGEKLLGIDEQISALKKSNSFLFEDEKNHGALHGSGDITPSSESFIHDIWDNQVKR